MSDAAKPGVILKKLRAERGWTLADLSARTGFPISTLSKIENEQMSLSYDKLARISRELDVDIGLFFAQEGGRAPQGSLGGRRSIIRKNDGLTIETGAYLHRFLAADLLNKRFVPILGQGFATRIEDFGEMIRHEGEEFCYVLEGTLEFHTDTYAPVRLEAGEGIYFDSGMGHAYISVGASPCKVLCICSGDESKLMGSLENEGGARRLEKTGKKKAGPKSPLKSGPKSGPKPSSKPSSKPGAGRRKA